MMSLQHHVAGEPGGETDGTDATAVTGQSADSSDPGLSDSDVFDVLRNSRRRAALTYLLDAEEPVTLRDLTKRVAAEEYDVDVDAVSADQHKRVYTGLYQCHLPRLDDFEVIDFDREEKTVRTGDTVSQVAPYLDDGGRPHVHAGPVVAVLVAMVVIPGVLGVGPLGAVPVTAWAVVTVVALLVAAGATLVE
jgi:uncharacterized protein YqfB (UPF0267 family)